MKGGGKGGVFLMSARTIRRAGEEGWKRSTKEGIRVVEIRDGAAAGMRALYMRRGHKGQRRGDLGRERDTGTHGRKGVTHTKKRARMHQRASRASPSSPPAHRRRAAHNHITSSRRRHPPPPPPLAVAAQSCRLSKPRPSWPQPARLAAAMTSITGVDQASAYICLRSAISG